MASCMRRIIYKIIHHSSDWHHSEQHAIVSWSTPKCKVTHPSENPQYMTFLHDIDTHINGMFKDRWLLSVLWTANILWQLHPYWLRETMNGVWSVPWPTIFFIFASTCLFDYFVVQYRAITWYSQRHCLLPQINQNTIPPHPLLSHSLKQSSHMLLTPCPPWL